MQSFILKKKAEIEALCRTHYVQRLSVFGSAVRDDFNQETSDVDVRVEFAPEALDDYLHNVHTVHDSLTEMFGRKVDLLTAKHIENSYLRKEIEDTQVVLYAA